MTIVDAHAHIYPQKISDKATAAVGSFYVVGMYGDGSAQGLLESGRKATPPITHHVVHSVATTPAQVRSINDFIAGECAAHPEFIGLASMHQDFEDPGAELDRIIGLGLRGVKLHPDIQKVNMDDDRLMAVYEAAQERGLPLIIHTGDYRYDYSHPRRMVRILHEFPQLVVDAAHFGGWSVFDMAVEYMEHERCFMDVSSSMAFLGRRRTRELIEIYGTDRIMFGSDFPMWDPADELETFLSLGFSSAEYEAMCHRNAERFLGMEIG